MAANPPWRLSWSGSEVRLASMTPQGQLRIEFSVVSAMHPSGIEGYLTGATLTLTPVGSPKCMDGAGQALALNEWLGAVAGGHWQAENNSALQQHLFIPMSSPAGALTLRLMSGSSLEARGQHLQITLEQQHLFRESFSC